MIDPRSVYIRLVAQPGAAGPRTQLFIIGQPFGRHKKVRPASPVEVGEIRAMPGVADALAVLEAAWPAQSEEEVAAA